MSKVHVIQHVAIEPLGIIGDVLSDRRIECEYTRVFNDEQVPVHLDGSHGLILMGGPMGANDFRECPFLLDELRLIGVALEREIPILGVCLGSQLIATALGESVYAGERKEIGWHDVALSPEAVTDPLFDGIPQTFNGFHWHGDVFDLPADATLLASSQGTECQAFSYEHHVYGFLFHMEVNERMIADWTLHFSDEVAETQQTAEEIISGQQEHLSALQTIGRSVFDRWAALISNS